MKKLQAEYNQRGTLLNKEFKYLFLLNEEVKNQASQYILYLEEGLIVNFENKNNVIGEHLAKIYDDDAINILSELFGKTGVILLYAQPIYIVKSKLKKDIIDLDITNDIISINFKEDDKINNIKIGKIYTTSSPRQYNKLMANVRYMIESHSHIFENECKFTMLKSDQIEKICNDLFKCKISDVDIRLSKQVVPGINLKREIGLVVDIENIKSIGMNNISHLYIIQKRSLLNNFHIYKIII